LTVTFLQSLSTKFRHAQISNACQLSFQSILYTLTNESRRKIFKPVK
jgi:hypothetical protein